MPVSFVFVHAHPITQRYRQRRAWKVSLQVLTTIWKYGKFTHDSEHPYDEAKDWLCFVFSAVVIFTEYFKQKDSVIKPSAIAAVTKSSMKSWSSATANCHLCCSGKRNGEQRVTKLSFDGTMMQALELLRLAKRHVSGWSGIEQWRNQAHSLSSYRIRLFWRHQSVRYSVSQ